MLKFSLVSNGTDVEEGQAWGPAQSHLRDPNSSVTGWKAQFGGDCLGDTGRKATLG